MDRAESRLMPGLKKLAARMLPPSLVGRYRGWRVRRLIAGYSPRVVEHQYGAARLRIELTDPMAAGWYDHDWSELPEIETLRGRTLRPGACVFDIGAHDSKNSAGRSTGFWHSFRSPATSVWPGPNTTQGSGR